MVSSTHPDISVIICTLNGGSRIQLGLNALLNQTLTQDSYEVIVVNDGSTDNTKEILKKYPVKTITHPRNRGRPQARNTGLQEAQGSIVAYLDDDCIPDKNWLAEISNTFKDPNVIAVGGYTKAYRTKKITEKYLSEIGYGNPCPMEFDQGNNVMVRFSVYIKNLYAPFISRRKNNEVFEIYTGNAAYRKSNALSIKGLDEDLPTSEDADISIRMRQAFPDKKIVFNEKAIITNQHTDSLIKLLRESAIRSKNTLKFYKKHNKIPPIYPFPIIFLILTTFSFIYNYILGTLVIILLPLMLYSWWIARSIKDKKPQLISCSYIQLSVESAQLLGYINGWRIYVQ